MVGPIEREEAEREGLERNRRGSRRGGRRWGHGSAGHGREVTVHESFRGDWRENRARVSVWMGGEIEIHLGELRWVF